MNWPDFYPRNCPPVEAEPASGTVYRLVMHNPPQPKDFQSTWEEFPDRFPAPTIINSGVSVWTDLQDIARLRKRFGHLRNRKIAKGELHPQLGLIQRSKVSTNSHVTWWIPIGAEPWSVFNVIDE